MKRYWKTALCLLLTALLLCGCGIEAIPMPQLPDLGLGSTELTARVEYINGRTLRVCVTEGDSHFNEGAILQVTFTSTTGSKTLNIGSTVYIRYNYTKQVSEHLGSPHISVNQLNVK